VSSNVWRVIIILFVYVIHVLSEIIALINVCSLIVILVIPLAMVTIESIFTLLLLWELIIGDIRRQILELLIMVIVEWHILTNILILAILVVLVEIWSNWT
jgi:hypothetical protein